MAKDSGPQFGWRKGDPLTAENLNRNSGWQNLTVGPGLTMTRAGNSIVISLAPQAKGTSPFRWFRITASTIDGTNKRWVYSMIEVYKTGDGYNQWTDVPGGITTTKGYNGIEDQNAATGTYGVNIASTNLSGTFALKPLYDGARVCATPVTTPNGTTEYWFVATNQVDGAC